MTRLWGTGNRIFTVAGNKLVTNRQCCCPEFTTCAQCIGVPDTNVIAVDLTLDGWVDSDDGANLHCFSSNLNGNYLLPLVNCGSLEPNPPPPALVCFAINLGTYQDTTDRGILVAQCSEFPARSTYVHRIALRIECFGDANIILYSTLLEEGFSGASPAFYPQSFLDSTGEWLSSAGGCGAGGGNPMGPIHDHLITTWNGACNELEPLTASTLTNSCSGLIGPVSGAAELIFG